MCSCTGSRWIRRPVSPSRSTASPETSINVRRDQHLAKLVSLPREWQIQVLEIVEPTLRLAIAFLLLVLFQPSVSAAQKGRAGEAAGHTDAFRDCADCPEMIVVPAGEFLMGSPPSERGRNPDEGPQRKVTFTQPFAVGKYEVTFAQWDACVAAAGCRHKPGDNDW